MGDAHISMDYCVVLRHDLARIGIAFPMGQGFNKMQRYIVNNHNYAGMSVGHDSLRCGLVVSPKSSLGHFISN